MFPRVFLSVVAILLLSFTKAHGQSAQPQKYEPAGLNTPPPQPDLFEASIGFTYFRANDALARNMYGADVSLFANLTSWLALGGEFIGAYGQENHQFNFFFRPVNVEESRFVYVAGPRITVWKNDKWKVFAEALGGGAHGHVVFLIGVDRSASADGFAAVLGGGAEWKFSRRLSWRVLEADYIPAQFNGQWESDFRVSTGLSYSFGSSW